nr:MAG TPA: hypothetical protein [Caudoviricetes sp.]
MHIFPVALTSPHFDQTGSKEGPENGRKSE